MRTLFFFLLTLPILSCAQERTPPAEVQAPTPVIERRVTDCPIAFVRSGVCLEWSWEKKPTSSAMGTVLYNTYRLENGARVATEVQPGVQPVLVLWMPAMGHGSSPTATSTVGAAHYRADNVFFVMPGEWELHFQIQQPEGTVVDEAVVAISL